MSSGFSSSRFSALVLPKKAINLHLMSCPGIRFTNDGAIATPEFLAEDLSRLQTHNTRMVLSCICDSEFTLGIERYADEFQRKGIIWRRVAIPDMTPPSPEHDNALDQVLDEAAVTLVDGGGLAIHCLAGLGRTGTVAARYAMSEGMSAAVAIDFIRTQHDKKAIETREQENYLIARELALHP